MRQKVRELFEENIFLKTVLQTIIFVFLGYLLIEKVLNNVLGYFNFFTIKYSVFLRCILILLPLVYMSFYKFNKNENLILRLKEKYPYLVNGVEVIFSEDNICSETLYKNGKFYARLNKDGIIEIYYYSTSKNVIEKIDEVDFETFLLEYRIRQ